MKVQTSWYLASVLTKVEGRGINRMTQETGTGNVAKLRLSVGSRSCLDKHALVVINGYPSASKAGPSTTIVVRVKNGKRG